MSQSRMNVLIVEDCTADTKLLHRWMSDSPFVNQVDCACDGKSALARLCSDKHIKPHVVLLDSNLPDMLGLDILAKLKKDPALTDVGFFILSGAFNEQDERRARELGASGYFVKPFDAEEFATFVRKIEEFWVARAGMDEAPG